MQTHLENKITETYDRALRRGELLFIDSTLSNITESDIEFEIRFAPNIIKKPTAESNIKHKFNPFLPYNQDLFVQEYDKHIILLNKYCLLPNHILIVTREYEEQTDPLNHEDLAAVWYCMMQIKSQHTLAFYNCGESSGASVSHKHIQIVPLPSDAHFSPPVNAIIYKSQDKKPDEIFTFQELPYVHYVILLDPQRLSGHHGLSYKETVSQYLTETYNSLMDAMVKRFRASTLTENFLTSLSYNFLMTHTWMMIVPRNSEENEISINSLGFAGMLLVKNKEELEYVKNVGVLRLLESAAFPKEITIN